MNKTPTQCDIAVLGAGVVGLSSALCIQRALPEAEVTIVAEKFPPNTTSDGSGGFWEPYSLSETGEELIRLTSATTFEHLTKLATSPLAAEIGVHLLSGYTLFDGPLKEFDLIKDILYGQRKLTQRELAMFPGATHGFFRTTVKVDVTPYLNWIMKQFKAQGGKVRQAKLKSLTELYDQYDVVVNCSGIGAFDLLGDTAVRPVRGQILRVDAPWIKHYYWFKPTSGSDSYVFPGPKFVVIGGTSEVGNWDTQAHEDVSRDLWERATSKFPQLKGARVISSWAGLRPARTTLRLEAETVEHGGRRIRVVHNYGHGGAGVTLHWGCALRSANLVAASLGPSGLTNKAKL